MKRRKFLRDAGLAGAALVGTGIVPDAHRCCESIGLAMAS
jgi:hypothetical protein